MIRMLKEEKSNEERAVVEEMQKNNFNETCEASPTTILDPEDSLMEKFQRTLHSHLTKVATRLSEEIAELEASIKQATKELEMEDICLYQTHEQVLSQRNSLERYQEALANTLSLQETKNHSVQQAKEIHKSYRCKLLEEKKKMEKLFGESKKLTALQTCFYNWESDLNNYLILSNQMSKKDLNIKKTILEQKQRRDYILYKLSEELWRLESEIGNFEEQVRIKDAEKKGIGQMIADLNTDLEIMHNKHKTIREAWNSVVANISKKDTVYQRFQTDRQDARSTFEQLQLETEKLRKETDKEMEMNEHLTSLCFRLKGSIANTTRAIATENEKICNIESQLLKLAKLHKRVQQDHVLICAKWQSDLNREKQVMKEFENVLNKKNSLEEEIFGKLEDKVVQDKAARHINNLLSTTKDITQEYQFLIAKTENSYGHALLDLERAENEKISKKTELEEISERNNTKEKEIDSIKSQIRNTLVKEERKRTKLLALYKTIEQLQKSMGENESSPQETKILRLEKEIEEIQRNVTEGKQFWMRHQGSLLSLSQQREAQLCELNLLQKEIMMTDQKNLKLEYALENLRKEELEGSKTIDQLLQNLQRVNADLTFRKDLKEELEEKTKLTKNEFMNQFGHLERDCLKLQNALKDFKQENTFLTDKLNEVHQEVMSWEKKLQIAQETIKKLKEERYIGEMAKMKTEIHKMEMRLSELKRIREKLVDDMELCVLRRDVITDKALGKLKRNPTQNQNRKIIAHKRLMDRKSKVRRIAQVAEKMKKDAAHFEYRVKCIRREMETLETTLKKFEDSVKNADTMITNLELTKRYNIQKLIFKQRKEKLLKDIKTGNYKAGVRSDPVVEAELTNIRTIREYLQYVVEKVSRDFPQLKESVLKISITLNSFQF